MLHTLTGSIVLILALTLVGIAIVLTPVLRYLGINKVARVSFGTMMIAIAAYLGWVARLFFQDEFGAVNYTPELFTIRLLAMCSAVFFLIAAYRCSRSLAAADPHVMGSRVRENGEYDPCSKLSKDDS